MDERQRSSITLIIVCGLSFAGKSTLANAICEANGFRQVDVDETKDEIFGPGVNDDEDLSPKEWTRIYTATDDKIVSLLRNGHSVVDASRNFRLRERNHARALAHRMGAGVVVVHVDAPETLVRRRWAENRERQARRDVSDKGFEQIIAAMQPPTPAEMPLVFHANDEIKSWLVAHAEIVAGKQYDSADGSPGQARR